MITTATRIEDLTLGITEEIRVRAPLEATFAALLEQLGPFNETTEDKPMPMKLEAWPGGRWYRDLGDNNGHFWGVVQAINRIGHEQGPRNLEQRRPLDGLHHSPEVPVVVAQVAVPSAAWPRLELHRHGFVFSRFVERSELLQQRRKRRLQRRAHADFFCDAQRQILNSCCCRDHFSSLK